MQEYYSTKEAAEQTGASRQIIRVYTESYRKYFSSEGAPAAGMPRKFTRDDLKLIRYIYESTTSGIGHTETIERLAAGELDTYAWQPPEEPTSAAQSAIAPDSALVPYERLQAAQMLLGQRQHQHRDPADDPEGATTARQELAVWIGGIGERQDQRACDQCREGQRARLIHAASDVQRQRI